MCLDCPNDNIMQIRESAFHSHKNALLEEMRNPELPQWTTTVLQRLSSRAWNPSVPQVERFWTGTITMTQLEMVFGDHIHESLTSQGLRSIESAIIKLLLPLFAAAKLMIQDRGRRYVTLRKGPPRLLPRPSPKHRQKRKRPRVLRLLGIHRRTETGTPPTAPMNPTNHTQRTIAPDRMKPTGPRQRRRRLRQLLLCPTPRRCMVTPLHSTTPSTSQYTHLVLGTLRTLIQNPVPQSQAEPYPKGRPPDNTRQ